MGGGREGEKERAREKGDMTDDGRWTKAGRIRRLRLRPAPSLRPPASARSHSRLSYASRSNLPPGSLPRGTGAASPQRAAACRLCRVARARQSRASDGPAKPR